MRLSFKWMLTGMALSCGALVGAEAPRPYTIHDQLAMVRISSPRPSPDGRWVAFVARAYDLEKNTSNDDLYVIALDSSKLRRLTYAESSDTSAQWSADSGTLYFLSSRSGSQQVWSLDLRGGEPQQRTSLPLDADNLMVSPQGDRFLVSLEVYPDCADLDCTVQLDQEKAGSKAQAHLYEHLFVRHWDSWEDGKRSHLFVVPIAGAGPIDITKGLEGDTPTKPFGGTEELAWSPDGNEVAFSAKLGRDQAWSTDVDIYLAQADGSGYRCITEANQAVDTAPAYSPDGKSIAYLAMQRPGFEADRQRVALYDRASRSSTILTEAWDRSAGAIAWSPDSKTLLITAEDNARQKIFALDLGRSGLPREIVSQHHNTDLQVTGEGELVFAQDSLTAPAEVFTCKADGGGLLALTSLNAERIAAVAWSTPEEFWFDSFDGRKVQGWLFRPAGFDPARKYPLAFLIHGGPQGAWLDQFHYRWNPQIYPGAGYVAVEINFRGSTGFGQEFTDLISGDWGGGPYRDLMTGLDYVLHTYPFIDSQKMGALGASYGGYMINWIAGHTDRFQCLVSHDGDFDTTSSYFNTEELWFPEWDFKGTPWENPELYEKWSPAKYVDRWKTPMLVVHGGKDYRVVETEGLSTFNALQRRGIPSQLLYFPNENHWVLKAKNSELWHQTVLAWLKRWLK